MKNRIISLVLLLTVVLSLFVGCFGQPEANISLSDIPDYSGKAYVSVNNGEPFFTEDEISLTPREEYSPLDPLGRCGVAFACIGIETMPTDKREDIGSVTPSGWKYNKISNNNEYDFVDGKRIYNRCHLIGFQLAGENANEKNLITGTRYLNIEGMLPFENQIASYIKATENHVVFRVTPIFDGENLVASGVLMEAFSVEDEGEGIKFCVYAYNVQPGVIINYFTGQNVPSGEQLPPVDDKPELEENYDYVINTETKKVHTASCTYAEKLSGTKRREFRGDVETLCEEFMGYSACRTCLPELIIPPLPEPEPEDTPDATEPEDTPTVTPDGEEITYIINTKSSSKKYHLPSCKNLPEKGDNRVDYTKSLEELLVEYPDYTPCGNCKPGGTEP